MAPFFKYRMMSSLRRPVKTRFFLLWSYYLFYFRKVEIFDKFGKYDTNRDGMISADEAHNVLREELGLDENCNNDGSVSYMELTEFYLAVEDK